MISRCPVVAITINHTGLEDDKLQDLCEKIHDETGLPTYDPLRHDLSGLLVAIERLRADHGIAPARRYAMDAATEAPS